MNRTGKGIFIVGVIFIVAGMLGGLILKNIYAVMMLAVGLYYIQWAQNDERCNINKDTKGNSLLIDDGETVKGIDYD